MFAAIENYFAFKYNLGESVIYSSRHSVKLVKFVNDNDHCDILK